MTERKVTTFQFYSLLYICSVVAAFMFVSTTVIDLGATDAILFPSVFGVISLITIIPTFIFNKKSNGESVLTAIRKRNKIFSDVVAFSYIILVFVLLNIIHFDYPLILFHHILFLLLLLLLLIQLHISHYF